MSRSNEAFWWSLFSAGGVMAALFVPACILASGFLLPTHDPNTATSQYKAVHEAVAWWPVRIVLCIVMCLSFFHCAHRVRHTLVDLGLRNADRALIFICYGAALAVSIATGVILYSL